MIKRNLAFFAALLIILAAGAGYYVWNKSKKEVSSIPDASENRISQEESFIDTFFKKLKSSSRSTQSGLEKYQDPAGIFSIQYPSSWVVREEKGVLLSGASFTPPELLNQYPEEERQFVKGVIAAATESKEFPSTYYENLVGEGNTGQTEAKSWVVNGYPAYMVKGEIKGVSYIVYIVSNGDYVVYFNYRFKETEEAHKNDIKKAIDFAPYLTDFEAAVNSIKFLN